MIDLPHDHAGIEVHIAHDGRLWVNGPEGCLLRAGKPENVQGIILRDDRSPNLKKNDSGITPDSDAQGLLKALENLVAQVEGVYHDVDLSKANEAIAKAEKSR